MATRDELKGLIAYLILAFPNFKPDVTSKPNLVDVFEDILGDLDMTELQVAAKSFIVDGGAFAPGVGEIRKKVSEMRMKASGVPTAGEAWEEVYNSFIRMPGGNMSGGGSSPILDHPTVRETVNQMGGFAAIGMDYDKGNIMASRAHFLKLYPVVSDEMREQIAQHPQITRYIEDKKQLTNQSIKQLADKFGGRK